MYNSNFESASFSSLSNGNGVDFSCTQLGGASFNQAKVFMADFSYAVLPPKDSCCPEIDSVNYNCGKDPWTNLAYGPTTPPVLNNVAIDCPDGSRAVCSGSQWQIPGWATELCNDEHTEQVLWKHPDCSGHHHDSTGIKISDPNLLICIANEYLNGDTTTVITPQLASTITSLNCRNMGIKDLGGLESFTNLMTLKLSGNQLTNGDFTELPTSLVTLEVASNDLSTIRLSSQHYNMTELDASDNQLTGIDIPTKTILRNLDLSDNFLKDGSSFQYFTALTYLDLSFNKLTSVGDMSRLQNLRTLDLENNQLTSIGNMGAQWACGLGTLYSIDLANNPCFDCNSLDPNSNCGQYDIVSMSKCHCDVTACNNCEQAQ